MMALVAVGIVEPNATTDRSTPGEPSLSSERLSSAPDTAPDDPAEAPEGGNLSLRVADPSDAADMLAVIRAAFAARPPVEPPADYLKDTVETVAGALGSAPGVVAELVDGHGRRRIVGCLLISLEGDLAGLHRVSVLPGNRLEGIAEAMVRGAVELATDLGATRLELLSRREFPATRRWWERHGFRAVREEPTGYVMRRGLPVRVEVPDAEAMRRLGRRLAGVVRAGDVLIASGDLGAGKTTLTQGLGAGLRVASPVISPTFVLSRIHRPLRPGPALVHVDAYRLSSSAELEDIDLDTSLADSVTLVEWGAGLAEGLSDSWLDVDIRRSGDPDDETRIVYIVGTGPRWEGVDLSPLADDTTTTLHEGTPS